jgi:membrane associated rhomboid family serine protease
MTPVVKKLLIINVALWFFSIVMAMVLSKPYLLEWFGLSAVQVGQEFWLWQLFTYMFLHSSNVFHLLFNMLLLWWIGAELEVYWGKRYFTFYYLACGVGGALIWCIGTLLYFLVTGKSGPAQTIVVGASGAIYGLLLAYGLIFGERVTYFLMLFPMKAKVFVLILAGVQVMNQLSEGFRSQEAVLAHLGGMVTGFLLLKVGPRIRDLWLRRQTRAHGRKLKLVVDNDRSGANGPKYWN